MKSTPQILIYAERLLLLLIVAAAALGLEGWGYSRHAGGDVMLVLALAAFSGAAALASRSAFRNPMLCVVLALALVGALAAVNFAFLQWMHVQRLHDLTPRAFADFAHLYGGLMVPAALLTTAGATILLRRASPF